MAKFKEASDRMMFNIYVCRKCKSKQRTLPQKVILKQVKCRGCGSKEFRALRKIKTAGK